MKNRRIYNILQVALRHLFGRKTSEHVFVYDINTTALIVYVEEFYLNILIDD